VPAAVAARGRYGPAFLAAVDAGLAVRPEQRPQTLAEFRAWLDRPDDAAPDITLPVGEPAAAVDLALEPAPAAPKPQTRWWYVAGALALGVLAWAVFGRG